MSQNMGDVVRMKIQFNEDNRIIVMPKHRIQLQALKSEVDKAFNLRWGSALIKYKDADGDYITIASDGDLALAFQGSDVPKFFVFTVHSAAKVPEAPSQQTCKFFLSSVCKFGSRCKFLHSAVGESSSAAKSPIGRLERWLEWQIEKSAAENIEHLSSPQGLDNLRTIAQSGQNQRLLLKLLSKEDIKSSMMRQYTNKIYGALPGTRFIMELQMQLNSLNPQTVGNVKPFVDLVEELQLRTAEGWKYLPLDALKTIIEGLPSSPGKDEMSLRVGVLLEQRRRLQLQSGCSEPDKCLKGQEFQVMPIIPSNEEILSKEPPVVPVNRIRRCYNSALEYLETHFQLLRADFIEPLRLGVQEYQKGIRDSHELRIYTEIKLVATKFTEAGMETRVTFKCRAKRSGQPIDWERSKRLMFGSLLCISRDNFQTLAWATVCGRDDIAKGFVEIVILNGEDLGAAETYVMVESSSAYYEAYSHVLRSLQRADMEQLPFPEHLISLERDVKEPSYLQQRAEEDLYDLGCAFPNMVKDLGRSTVRLLQDWPEWSCSLDISQKMALKHALTKRLAIIQGPPGTGKTHLGLLLVKILLANLKALTKIRHVIPGRGVRASMSSTRKEAVLKGPVLVVCYTNHALDQFLEGIYVFEKNLIRVGGRSKSKILDERTLQNVVRSRETRETRLDAHVRATGRARVDRLALEERRNCQAEILNSDVVKEECLPGIATEEQIRSLFDTFCIGRKEPESLVRAWINGEEGKLVSQAESSESGHLKEDLDDDGWINVRRKKKADKSKGWVEESKQKCFRGDEFLEGPPLITIVNDPDVWSLSIAARRKLHKYWLNEMQKNAQAELTVIREQYAAANRESKETENEVQLELLRNANIVGMTTTKAASLHDVLVSLKPEIVIVEEAAEVLEAQILASLSPYTKHLVLIGDHQQLRPSVATYNLAVRNHLDVSMFERLVVGGVDHVMLQVQRRMRPCISKLISHIYPDLKDHESVKSFEDVKGMSSSLFFMDHKAFEEAGNETGSKINATEAELVAGLCKYLLKQGCYKPENITILAMYKGQVEEIRRRLKNDQQDALKIAPGRSVIAASWIAAEVPQTADDEHSASNVRVSSVDDFQGEENDIILLSLVRSNKISGKGGGDGTIGFLKTSNRVCVALSRARKGMYIFGNGELLVSSSPLWRAIIRNMRQDGFVGPKLLLRCVNHPKIETGIERAAEFSQVEDGGCTNACEFQFECGHACPRRCHPTTHDGVICPKLCLKALEQCSHRCKKVCHSKSSCPPCRELVIKTLPQCGHEQLVPCSQDPAKEMCASPCEKTFSCGHKCASRCGLPCRVCERRVLKQLHCGHQTVLPCHRDPSAFSCNEPCRELLSECKHACGGTCGSCKQGTKHIPCQKQCGRDLPCGHECKAGCTVSCPPCKLPCEKRCFHSKCPRNCGQACRPCIEPCSWNCKHFRCDLLCFEACERPPCDSPCDILLQCGHPCIGLCGELCPKKCRICHPNTIDVITQLTLEESDETDRFIELQDCEHIFEVSGLDQWMGMAEDASSANAEAIKLKSCPECRTPIRRTLRYSNVVNRKLQQIEVVKRRVLAYQLANMGFEKVKSGAYGEAVKDLKHAIVLAPGLFEAHLGLGSTLQKLRKDKEAISHYRLIIEKSRFAADIEQLPKMETTYNPLPQEVEASSLTTKADQALAIQALLQWASILGSMGMRKFPEAVQLCEIVLKHDETNEEAKKLKENADNGKVVQQVVQAVSAEFKSKGHWYNCPNGHVYVVGECGGPTQTSTCPDCQATIGGTSHTPAAGNVHSNIDGSSHPLYDTMTGLGNFDLNELG